MKAVGVINMRLKRQGVYEPPHGGTQVCLRGAQGCPQGDETEARGSREKANYTKRGTIKLCNVIYLMKGAEQKQIQLKCCINKIYVCGGAMAPTRSILRGRKQNEKEDSRGKYDLDGGTEWGE